MLISILCLLLFAGTPQVDAFKKEMIPLQTAVETAVSPVVARIYSLKVSYLDDYGIVVSMDVALELPPNPFSTPRTSEQVKATVTQRRKDLQNRLSDVLKTQIVKSASIEDSESLAVIVHLLPTTRADAGDQPTQLVLSVKKASPTQVKVSGF